MKKTILNLVIIQIIVGALFLSLSLPFHSCEPDETTCDTCGPVVMKPNIYLYPAVRSQISVNLSFPLGGKIITSIPEYENGWNVDVDTSGIIDNKYEYLFYESKQPDVWQLSYGWVIKKSELEIFFKDNMLKHGFNGRETGDFLEYWIPRLTDFKYYEIYPQEMNIINKAITLEISKKPEEVLRLYYLIKGVNSDSDNRIKIPGDIIQFQRNGFHVTEWGVILAGTKQSL
jgi:hypothetical protein